MKAIRWQHGICGPESDERSLMNLIAALNGPLNGIYRVEIAEIADGFEIAEVKAGGYRPDQDPVLAEEMKRKFQAIRDKILGPRNH
jgi:hypothetical protein